MLDARRLAALVIADGESWARETAAHLRGERRAAAGGWPGTLSEARARVAGLLATLPPSRLTHHEHEDLARQGYAAARRAWAESAVADRDE